MKNEAEFKSVFKKAVKNVGGFCESLAAPTMPGIPDLYCIVPGFMPVLLEAKFFKIGLASTFTRKIPYTAMQYRWLTKTNEVHHGASFGLLGAEWNGNYYCLLAGPEITHLSAKLIEERGRIIIKKSIDVQELFYSHVPKSHIQPIKALAMPTNA